MIRTLLFLSPFRLTPVSRLQDVSLEGTETREGRRTRVLVLLQYLLDETRKGGDAQKGVKDNMLLAFNNIMPRLDAVYAARAAEAPEGFEERINFWHRECGMRAELKGRLHSLRIWANAARHHDADRWRRDGPCSEAEASHLVSSVVKALKALERDGC